MSRYLERCLVAIVVLVAFGASPAHACGPFLPISILDAAGLLSVPETPFEHRLRSLTMLPTPEFLQVDPESDAHRATIAADAADLRAALTAAGTTTEAIDRATDALEVARATVAEHQLALDQWRENVAWGIEEGPAPTLGTIALDIELPTEFRLYWQGALAYHRRETTEAEAHWRAVLALPSEARQYRSTWAAFMLGRLAGDHEPDVAIARFEETQALAREGFVDTLGLAGESVGWAARAHLHAGRHVEAIEGYARRFVAGDAGSATSLRIACRAAAENEAGWEHLATHPTVREILTVFLDSYGGDHERAAAWVEHLRDAGTTSSEAATAAAWSAYRDGRTDEAERWLDVAGERPRARWLKARLALRAGETEEARRLLRAVADEEADLPGDPWSLGLRVHSGELVLASASRALGESGALDLAAGDYRAALEALLASGFWLDAVLVAERILTLEELHQFVDRLGANSPSAGDQPDGNTMWNTLLAGIRRPAPDLNRSRLRALLARRLARQGSWLEAAEYHDDADPARRSRRMAEALRAWADPHRDADERSETIWQAAKILREHGLELIGTEGAPDWAHYEGQLDLGASEDIVRGLLDDPHVAADVARRMAASRTEPDRRWHYRYKAAELGWQAASVLPDDDDRTATILTTAGGWLKYRDPEAANRFYQALVRRCPNTDLGRRAAELRWFPPSNDP